MNPRIKAMSGVMLQALSAAQQDVLVDLWQVDLRPGKCSFQSIGIRVMRCTEVEQAKIRAALFSRW